MYSSLVTSITTTTFWNIQKIDYQFFNRMDTLIEYVVYRTIDLVNRLKSCFPTPQVRKSEYERTINESSLQSLQSLHISFIFFSF